MITSRGSKATGGAVESSRAIIVGATRTDVSFAYAGLGITHISQVVMDRIQHDATEFLSMCSRVSTLMAAWRISYRVPIWPQASSSAREAPEGKYFFKQDET